MNLEYREEYEFKLDREVLLHRIEKRNRERKAKQTKKIISRRITTKKRLFKRSETITPKATSSVGSSIQSTPSITREKAAEEEAELQQKILRFKAESKIIERENLAGCCAFFTDSLFEQSIRDSNEKHSNTTTASNSNVKYINDEERDQSSNSASNDTWSYVVDEHVDPHYAQDLIDVFERNLTACWPATLRRNKDVGWNMRCVIVDWLMKVCSDKGVRRYSYHLAVHLFDMYLHAVENFARTRLQSLAAVCLLLACKHDGSNVTLQDLRYFFPQKNPETACKLFEIEVCKVEKNVNDRH